MATGGNPPQGWTIVGRAGRSLMALAGSWSSYAVGKRGLKGGIVGVD